MTNLFHASNWNDYGLFITILNCFSILRVLQIIVTIIGEETIEVIDLTEQILIKVNLIKKTHIL